MYTSKVKKAVGFTIFFLLVGLLVYLIIDGVGVRRGIPGLEEPKQTEATGNAKIIKNGYDVDVQYLYAYEVDALVVHAQRYTGLGLGDQLSPVDLGIAWGKVAEYNDKIDFHWSQGGRWLNWRTKTYEEIEPVGGEAAVMEQASNNHIIPANSTIRSEVLKIRRGDRVRLKGYLVNISAAKSNGASFWWNSSTSRTDTGAHACEVFYVTKVEIVE